MSENGGHDRNKLHLACEMHNPKQTLQLLQSYNDSCPGHEPDQCCLRQEIYYKSQPVRSSTTCQISVRLFEEHWRGTTMLAFLWYQTWWRWFTLGDPVRPEIGQRRRWRWRPVWGREWDPVCRRPTQSASSPSQERLWRRGQLPGAWSSPAMSISVVAQSLNLHQT